MKKILKYREKSHNFGKKIIFTPCISISFLFLLTFQISLQNLSAQPLNDSICSAIQLQIDAKNPASGTNVNATTVAGDPIGTCWLLGTKSHTVWYYFFAPASGNVTITTDHLGGTLTDSQIAVFASSDNTCNGNLTEVGCDDDAGITCNRCASVKLTGLIPEKIYFVELDGYANNTGTFYIDIHNGGIILTNDNCSNAMNMWVGQACNLQSQCTHTGHPTIIPVTTATAETWETAPACWTQGTTLNTVWFKFIAIDATTNFQIEAVGGGTDPHVGIYSGVCGNLTLIACQEDKGGAAGKGVNITFATTVGQTYYIQYDNDVAQGCNYMCLNSPGGKVTPSNNLCANAPPLALNTPVTGNTWLATSDGAFSCGSTENSIWYKYTAPATNTYYFTLSEQSGCMQLNNSAPIHTGFYVANLQMAIYNTSTCTPVATNTITCSETYNTNDFELSALLTADNTYLLLVDGLGGAACEFRLQVTPDPILSIDLIFFDGYSKEDVNILEWSTASEINNDYFTVERSPDGKNFSGIGKIKGNGNSIFIRSYNFIDNSPVKGISYYRLKQTDFDGTETYTKIIAITNNYAQANLFDIYPNPNDGKSFKIYVGDYNYNEEALIIIRNICGSELYKLPVNNDGENTINLENKLPAGVYIVTLLNKNKIYSNKIIVK